MKVHISLLHSVLSAESNHNDMSIICLSSKTILASPNCFGKGYRGQGFRFAKVVETSFLPSHKQLMPFSCQNRVLRFSFLCLNALHFCLLASQSLHISIDPSFLESIIMSYRKHQLLWVLALLLVVAPRHSFGQTAYATGLELTDEATFTTYPSVKTRATRGLQILPESFSLKAFLPPIADQGDTFSCVGWATAYYCYTMSEARQRKLSPEERKSPQNLFSPGWIWHRFNQGNAHNGMQIFRAFDVLEKEGCSSLADYPWDATNIRFSASEETKKSAKSHKARQSVCLSRGARSGTPVNPSLMKSWLYETETPFVTGIPILDDFGAPSRDPDFVYNSIPEPGKRYGYHAITIIGYDSKRQAFQLVNSWSENWGNKGTLWIAEEFIVKNCLEAWGQRPGGRKARNKDSLLEIVEPEKRP